MPHGKSHELAFPFAKLIQSWPGAAGLAAAVGIAYFLAFRLGMFLHGAPEGLAVFSPAAGIATGVLIALGSAARLPVAAAVITATFACSLIECSLIMGRIPWITVPISLANAAQPSITAWLIARWFVGVFKLEDVRHVLGFLVASAVGATVSATAATVAIELFEPTASFFSVWRLWFASCLLGIITVAPLLIGVGEAVQQPPPRRELFEGALALAILAALSAFLISLPPGAWATALPVAIALPVVLWVAVRCRPVFAAAAAFVVALTVVWSTTFNMGHFGDATIPLADRILGAQTLVLAGTLLVLVLAALFSERRRSEAALKQSKERLQLALDGAELGALSADLTTGRLECDARAAQIHGHETSPLTIKELRRFIPADDRMRIDAALAEAKRSGGRWNAEYRVLLPPGHPRAGETVWIAVDSSIVRDRQGTPVGLLGVIRDITERKRAEQALADVDVQRALAGRAGLVGTYAYDTRYDGDDEKAQISPGYAAIHGLPDGTSEITRGAWLARMHPEDAERLQTLRNLAFRRRQREYSIDYRIIRSGEVRWIESRTFISYNGDGRPQRVIGVNIDVTDRKRTEALLSESKDLLADAMAAGQVMAFEWDAITGQSQRSDNAVSILGSEEHGTRLYHNAFVMRVHPDDRANLKRRIRELRPADASYALSFRYVRPDGRQIWLEETAKGEFDGEGRLLRIKGLTRDITERKNAELALAERNVQLALAAKAGLVGSYSYDPDTDKLHVSEGYAAIHGLPEGTKESTRSAWQSRTLPEDRERINLLRMQAFRERRGEYGAEYRIRRAGEVRWIESRSFMSYNRDGRPQRVIGVNIDITERKRAEERQGFLVAELDHRVKNVLAIVNAVVSHTEQESRSVADFIAALEGRIRSMATTHELLSSSRWQGISLAELIRCELAPYATRNNTEINGPEALLKSEAAQAIAMVLHELATNAAKYGALSTKKGRISIRWHWRLNGYKPSHLVLDWQEIGGPPVAKTSKSGYGTSTIRDLIPYEFGGTVELVFAPDGVRCRLEFSSDWLSDNDVTTSAAIA